MRDGESKLTFQGSPKVDPCPNDVKEISRFHQLPLGLPDRGGRSLYNSENDSGDVCQATQCMAGAPDGAWDPQCDLIASTGQVNHVMAANGSTKEPDRVKKNDMNHIIMVKIQCKVEGFHRQNHRHGRS